MAVLVQTSWDVWINEWKGKGVTLGDWIYRLNSPECLFLIYLFLFCFAFSLSEYFRGGGNMHLVGTVVLLNLVTGKIGVYGKNMFGKILYFPGI